MGTIDESHGSPLPLAAQRQRHLPASAALSWLGAGWRDLWLSPLPSLVYGFVVFLVSLAIVWGLFRLELDYILFPALAGFMVVGPLLAIGLYQKSRDIEQGRSVSLARMIFVKAASGGQVWFTGAILCLLMLVWMRAAVIIYALFFGLRPFPGLHDVATMLVTTPTGWAMLLVGTAAGGLFAAFSFARLLETIPLTPSGVGFVETGAVAALIGFGGSEAASAAAVFLFRGFTYLAEIPVGAGAWVVWATRRSWRRPVGTADRAAV